MAGIYIEGELKGYKAEPWKNGNGVTHYLGIKTGGRVDEWGEEQETIQKVVIPKEQASKAAMLAEKAKGRMVRVQVFLSVKEGKWGPWQQWIMPKNGEIELLKPKTENGREAA